MTQVTIQSQVEVINKATEKAAKSKESAKKFLIDAGIIKDEKQQSKTKEKK